MQALPAWHLYGFRRSLCNSALLYQPLNPRWQRRAPGAPVFGARAADNAPTGKTKDAAAISKQRDRLQPTKDRKRQVATVKRRGNRIRSWDPLAGVSEPRTTRNRETKSDNKPRKQSLLEELFPEETNGHGKAAKRAAKTREIPRRPMGFTSTGFEEEMPTPDVKPREHKQYHDSHVLVMKNGPKCLLEEDFRRLVPGGGHLEGWNSVGDLMKVIRGRDQTSLSATGDYYLLFRTSHAADSYKRQVRRLFRECQEKSLMFGSYSMSHSLHALPNPLEEAGIPPSFGFKKDTRPAEEEEKQAKERRPDPLVNFTLALPTQRLDLRIAKRPYAPVLRQILEHGGYPKLSRGRLTDHEVLISAEGMQPSLQALQYAISEDGRGRGMRWNIAGTSKSVREVVVPRHEGVDIEETEGEEDDSEETVREHWKKAVWKKWIVPCKTANEAERFVSAWHRRDINGLMGGRVPVGEECIVNAELV